MPAVATRAELDQLPRDAPCWHDAATAIGRRHGLAGSPVRLDEGSNCVFAIGPSLILKLYPPFWSDLAGVEAEVLKRVQGKLGVETPEVVAADEIDGWPYLVMSRVGGVVLARVWSGLTANEQRRLAIEVGELLARLHAVPTDGLLSVSSDWPAIMRERVAGCVERRRGQALNEAWLRQIPGWLASAEPLYPLDFAPAIVTGDVHQYHLTVRRKDDGWRLAGYFDFDDAMIGFAEYDLAAPGVFLTPRRPELLRALLLAYGYPEEALDEGLSQRLLAYTLLHRYRDLDWLLREVVRDPECATLEELAKVFYDFSAPVDGC